MSERPRLFFGPYVADNPRWLGRLTWGLDRDRWAVYRRRWEGAWYLIARPAGDPPQEGEVLVPWAEVDGDEAHRLVQTVQRTA